MNTYNSNILGQAIDHFVNQGLSDVFGVDLAKNQPSVNIQEMNDSHILEVAVPGIPKDKIDVKIEQDQLIVSAKREELKKNESDDQDTKASADTTEIKYEQREFNFQSFERSFKLPETADKEKVSASYDAGILRIEIAKKEEAVDRGPISIKVL